MPQWLLIGLRVVHIVSGVAWVGSVLLFAGFVVPTARSMGPTQGVGVLNRFLDRRWFAAYFTTIEALTVLTGLVLYWNLSGGFLLAWVTSPPGVAFGLGGIAAIVALIVSGRVSQLLGQLYALEEADRDLDEQGRSERFRSFHQALARANGWYVGLLLVAVVAMASARYL